MRVAPLMRPERDEQERGNDGHQSQQGRLQNAAEHKPDHAWDRTRYRHAPADQRHDRKIDGEPGNDGDEEDRAQRRAFRILQRQCKQRTWRLHRNRRRQDGQAHHQRNCHDDRGNKSDRARGKRSIESLQCAEKVEGKPGKDFKCEQPSEEAAERRLAERNGIGFCDLVKNDETMDGD
jgi:hypothetical protein